MSKLTLHTFGNAGTVAVYSNYDGTASYAITIGNQVNAVSGVAYHVSDVMDEIADIEKMIQERLATFFATRTR